MGSGASAAAGCQGFLAALPTDDLVEAIKAVPDELQEKLKQAMNKAGVKGYEVPTCPVVYLTSTGFVSDTQWSRFIQVILKRRGVLYDEDAGPEVEREFLVDKYADEIKKLKVTYINDASYHRPTANMAAGRAGDGKVGEDGNLGRGEGTWFWWDQGLQDLMGIAPENITMIQLFEKPWLFNVEARDANHHESKPDVSELDPEDEKAYRAALKLTQDAYDALKEKPPKTGAGQAGGGDLPGCPASGESCANELAKISVELNEKYKDALDKWCAIHIDAADIIVGQGGEVVMLNMAWQCNQYVATRVVQAVRANKCVYAGLSASTMVTAKSMEMTHEIQPGWIEAFAASKKYLKSEYFDKNDKDGDGTKAFHLGALPLIDSPLAIRPHYSKSWENAVLKKNLAAEAEFEKESGIDIDDALTKNSGAGCEQACKLLTIISSAPSMDQDNPVFIPIRNGKVIEVKVKPAGPDYPNREVFESFHCIA
mmetsp:Transcript_128598/g.274314  ORF Transcript_128598/g.274314 Transcript_128598/m.274314 type:complete len:483 (+) Transcript_128598:42-1490(+)